ncbi:hypothetical protein DKX38_024984 [Salix brachista]|uniref:Uncharacterized protein n=1 Tax=Salix brachista TaxID=2182728 RepID=A0A5N5JU31_9ROSI|nr:hypothetical protein DKX38_024984 [Salix brachista]
MSSSISQSVMMALTVTVNKFASSNVHAVHKKDSKRTAKAATMAADIGRRGVLLSTVVGVYSVNDSKTELLKRYLKKSEDNRAKNDKESSIRGIQSLYFPFSMLLSVIKYVLICTIPRLLPVNDWSVLFFKRMDSYYKRNYKDYFDFVEGSLRGKNEQDLTESEKGILDWLQKNK